MSRFNTPAPWALQRQPTTNQLIRARVLADDETDVVSASPGGRHTSIIRHCGSQAAMCDAHATAPATLARTGS